MINDKELLICDPTSATSDLWSKTCHQDLPGTQESGGLELKDSIIARRELTVGYPSQEAEMRR